MMGVLRSAPLCGRSSLGAKGERKSQVSRRETRSEKLRTGNGKHKGRVKCEAVRGTLGH